MQTLKDGVPTQKYPLWDFVALVIISVLFVIFPVVLVMNLIFSSSLRTAVTMVLLLFMNLYHCTPLFVTLLSVVFNEQVNSALPPSHTVTSSGLVISVVEINRN